jgi:hypothetical protein
MARSQRILVLVVAVVAFLLVSAALARILSANGAERSAVRSALVAQASGDPAELIAAIDGCAQQPGCREMAAANAAALRSSGELEMVRLDLSTGFSPFDTTGTARIVWKTPSRLTVVQCARVHRAGNFLSGIEVDVVALSRPIGRETSCP